MNPKRTFEMSIPSFCAHHAQTPKDRISKKKAILWISFIQTIIVFRQDNSDISLSYKIAYKLRDALANQQH